MKKASKSLVVIAITLIFVVVLAYIFANNDVAEIPYIYLDF